MEDVSHQGGEVRLSSPDVATDHILTGVQAQNLQWR